MEDAHSEGLLERTPVGVRAPRLEGVRGRIRFETEDGAAYLLRIDDGKVELTSGRKDAEAVVVCESKTLIARLLNGEASLVVETLQGHSSATGDMALLIKVALELQARSPFAVDQASKDTPS